MGRSVRVDVDIPQVEGLLWTLIVESGIIAHRRIKSGRAVCSIPSRYKGICEFARCSKEYVEGAISVARSLGVSRKELWELLIKEAKEKGYE